MLKWIAIWLVVLVDVAAPSGAENYSRPNIVFLFADDQRSDTIGALGNPVIKTPNLDRLVRTGMSFQNVYCLGANEPAVCSPSRNMLLSGRAYFRWKGRLAPANGPNLPGALKSAGYVTYHHGKKGNTATEIQHLFDFDKYVHDDFDRTNGEPARDIVDAAIEFLDQRPREKPFFLYLAFSNPHDPRVAAQKYLDIYPPDSIPLPKNFLPVHPFDNGEMEVRDEKLVPWPRTPEVVRHELRDYYAVISAMDHHIGRLLSRLELLGLSDKTIVVYSADHGLAMGSHGLFGKQNLYDHSMKAPLIISGPGVRHGRSDALVYLHDLFPTFCDLAGAPVPAGLDAVSFAPALRGQSVSNRETLFLAYRDVQRAIRDSRWKLIRYPEINFTQLFDLINDPDEISNLSGNPDQSQRIGRLLAQMQAWQRELGDTLPLTSRNPKPQLWSPPIVEPKVEGQAKKGSP